MSHSVEQIIEVPLDLAVSEIDSHSPDDRIMLEALREEIGLAMSTLSAEEARILRLYFGLDGKPAMTLEEIAEKLTKEGQKRTRERVRQIKEKGLTRLRHRYRAQYLSGFLADVFK